jgi:mRNA-degrading endonuclease toxin of MazEF toxin-antitoxin module
VIISAGDDYQVTGEMLVIPITKRSDQPCPYYHVLVHDSTAKNPDTGLYFPCWAKCNWARWIDVRRIRSAWGHLPDDVLKTIADTFDALYADETFDDWH